MEEARAKKGTYFAISAADAQRLVTESGIVDRSGNIAKVMFQNSVGRKDGRIVLLAYDPRGEIIMFSVPDPLPYENVRSKIRDAIGYCKLLNNGHWEPKGNSYDYVILYIKVDGTLGAVERRVYYQRRKYRGSAKFSTAFKQKVLKTTYRELKLPGMSGK